MGAAGSVEAIFTILAVHYGIVPPTLNLEATDEEMRLDYVPLKARHHRILHAISNSFGFGGTNASLIFSKETSKVD